MILILLSDFIFLFGLEAIFRVSLSLLALHKQQLLACHSFEKLITYLKEELVRTDPAQLQSLFSLAAALDVTRQLLVYEIEYQVIQEEMQYRPLLQATNSFGSCGSPAANTVTTANTPTTSTFSSSFSSTSLPCSFSSSQITAPVEKQRKISSSVAVGSDTEMQEYLRGDSPTTEKVRQLEKENKNLRNRNMEILDQLHVAQSSVYNLESSLDSYKSSIRRLETRVRALEDERDALLHMVAK